MKVVGVRAIAITDWDGHMNEEQAAIIDQAHLNLILYSHMDCGPVIAFGQLLKDIIGLRGYLVESIVLESYGRSITELLLNHRTVLRYCHQYLEDGRPFYAIGTPNVYHGTWWDMAVGIEELLTRLPILQCY